MNKPINVLDQNTYPSNLLISKQNELDAFLGDNLDLVPLINSAIDRTLSLDNMKSVTLRIFDDPVDQDQSLYIHGVVFGAKYDDAYEAEGVVFQDTMDGCLEQIGSRILLSFDTELDHYDNESK